MLRAWHVRYGDLFTVRLIGFGTGVYLVDLEAIRELSTGDQSDLRAGEANSFLEPVLGPHSLLVLDGPEHLRFTDEGAESYSWLPFGGGIRRCIGAALAQAEMAEVLWVAVPAVELRLLRQQPDPVVLRGVTLAPKHGVRAVVERVGVRGRRAIMSATVQR